jgi:hypothetical protein
MTSGVFVNSGAEADDDDVGDEQDDEAEPEHLGLFDHTSLPPANL